MKTNVPKIDVVQKLINSSAAVTESGICGFKAGVHSFLEPSVRIGISNIEAVIYIKYYKTASRQQMRRKCVKKSRVVYVTKHLFVYLVGKIIYKLVLLVNSVTLALISEKFKVVTLPRGLVSLYR